MTDEELRYGFVAEWQDTSGGNITKHFLCVYWPKSREIQLTQKKRLFLKRTAVPHIGPDSMYLGNRINVLSRQMVITKWADNATEALLGSETAVGVCDDHGANLAAFLLHCAENNWVVKELRSMKFPSGLLSNLGMAGASFASGTAWSVTGPRCQSGWNFAGAGVYLCSGPAGVSEAALFPQSAQTKPATTASVGSSSAVCVVKPSAIDSAGRVMQDIIRNGLTVQAVQLFRLSPESSAEFMEVYKGIVSEYPDLVTELTTGPCIAIEVTSAGQTVPLLRNLAGPHDPAVARHIRPKTMRALYGSDRVRNGVHSTDLSEDGPLEAEYFFRILQSQ